MTKVKTVKTAKNTSSVDAKGDSDVVIIGKRVSPRRKSGDSVSSTVTRDKSEIMSPTIKSSVESDKTVEDSDNTLDRDDLLLTGTSARGHDMSTSRLTVLMDDKSRRPHGDFVVKLKSVEATEIVDFVHNCLEIVENDRSVKLPCLGKLIQSEVLMVLDMSAATPFDASRDDHEYVEQVLRDILKMFVAENAFENLLAEASEIVRACDSFKDDFGAVMPDQMRKYNFEWLQLLKRRPMTGWDCSRIHEVVDLFVRGLKPRFFSEKVSRDLDDLRHYGNKERSVEDPKAVILEEDSVKGVGRYALGLVDRAKFHKTLGKAIVGVRKSSVDVHKRRSSETVSGSDELDLDFSANRGRGGRHVSRRGVRAPMCVYCGKNDHFVWSCSEYMSPDMTRKLVSGERWRVDTETLDDCDMRDERSELEDFRCDIRREEEFARSKGHRPDDYLVKAEPRDRGSRGHQRSRRETSRPRGSAPPQTDKSVQILTKLVEDQQQSLHIMARAIENLATKLDTVSSVKPSVTLEDHKPNPSAAESAKEESSLQFDDLLSSSDVIDDEKSQTKVKIISDTGTRTRYQPVEPNGSSATGKLMRWFAYLVQYDYEIHHVAGNDNDLADFLSRFITTTEPISSKSLIVHEHEWKTELISLQEKLGTTERGDCNEEFVEEVSRVKRGIVKEIHIKTGYGGRDITAQRLKELGIGWKNLTKDIKDVVSMCIFCQKLKKLPLPKIRGTITSAQPFRTISTDVMGPLETD
ncbi:hypothetical protein ADUPG1_010847 [Aduncisulcus paluster]|uniref:Integrase zinc-binding domain-containing protein n=1 Tax=Aduncisulcus paluster TaxID=2918883 RepID=A0ABQ5JV92_9EUKA|nr:hypothetical protein ADUPG1_010847 [Aduncisulcus paluster]